MKLSLIPLLPFTAVFILGILLQGCGMSGFFILIPVAAAITAALLKHHYLSILFLGCALGAAISDLHTPHPLDDRFKDCSSDFSAVAIDVRRFEPTQVIIAEVDSCNGKSVRPFRAKLSVPSSIPTVDERWRIRFTGRLQDISHDPDLPDETDYNATLRRNGVIGQALISPDSLRILSPEPGIINTIRRQREKITLLIAGSPLSDHTQEFLNAALTGDRSMIDSETHEIFSASGLSHILALSGLHVGILTLILSLMLLPLYFTGLRTLRTILLIILLWAFAVMTGLTPSVVRAVIMASIFMLSTVIQRVRSPFNSLCFAALIILVFSPQAIYTIGFQLSFFAVAAILVFAEKLNPFSRRRQIAHTLASYPTVTIAALLGTGLVSAYYFHIFPLYSIPVNFISALLLPFILGGGLLLLLANAFGFQCLWLADMVDRLYSAIHSVASAAVSMPGAVAEGLLITPLTLASWFLTLTLFAFWLYRRRPVYATASIMLLTFTVFTAMTSHTPIEPGAEIYIPRTGRQTSVLIRHNNTMLLASTAPGHETGELIDRYTGRYGLFMLKRGIDSIQPLPLRCRSSLFSRNDNLFIFHPHCNGNPAATAQANANGPLSILLISDKTQVEKTDRRINYAIVCNGFRGDILSVASEISPDTIILSADLNRRRHDRYLRELTEASIPHRTLRTTPFVKRLRGCLK